MRRHDLVPWVGRTKVLWAWPGFRMDRFMIVE